jgi:hypothetical protein
MKRDEPDIGYLLKPRSTAVMGRWQMEEIEEGDRIPSSRQQETTAFGRGGMSHRVAGMSSHMGIGKETRGSARGAP